MDLDINTLTLAELELVEEMAGGDAVDRLFAGKLSPKAMRALVLVSLRRSDPDATWDDAGDVKVGDFRVDATEDPTDAAG